MSWPDGTRWDGLSPRVIYPFATAVTVSTETPLLALTEFGELYADLVFTVRNHHATNTAQFYIEQSESGVVTDEDRESVTVGPLKERRYEFRDILALSWGLTASGAVDAGLPTVNVSWQVVGRRRRAAAGLR